MDHALSLRARLLAVVGAAALGFLGSPGVLDANGSLVLAVLGVALWAWAAVHPLGTRPGRARAIEWLGGALAGGLMMWWVVHVVVFGVLYIGAGWGVYFVVMGALLRRLARAWPLPVAVLLVWTGVELLRSLLPPPFGLGWFRLGFYTHATPWLAGAARVIGVEGLGAVTAALGGGVAALALERRLRVPTALGALGPLLLAALLVRAVPAPVTIDGPRVLLVQPGFSQQVKQHDDPQKNLEALCALTHRAAAAVGPVDLVCWGESMLYLPVFTPAAEAAIRGDRAAWPAWQRPETPRDLEGWRRLEEHWVRDEILGLHERPRPFPEGASFSVGVEAFDLVGGEVRRKVALVLYDAAGGRSPLAFKRFLVPLGETFFGLERFAPVRALAAATAGYVPDLEPGTETGLLELRGRDGRTWHASGTVCFDNAHPWPYLDALRRGTVDFHLVASNEAWYRTSCEMDQMVAFSRMHALTTGRAFVRATNSGVSLVLGPDGREVGRVRDAAGRDRAVEGFGAWSVPVPLAGQDSVPPYVRWSRLSEGLWLAGLVLAGLRRPRNRPGEAG